MTDINKQIEEEAREYSNYALTQDGYIKGYKSALHSSRWRKVSEELPEEDITILIQTKQGKRMAVYLHDREWCIIGTNDLVDEDIIEFWKPID